MFPELQEFTAKSWDDFSGAATQWGLLAAASTGTAVGIDHIDYKFCTYSCGDPYDILNNDYQSGVANWREFQQTSGEPLPRAARVISTSRQPTSAPQNCRSFKRSRPRSRAVVPGTFAPARGFVVAAQPPRVR